MQQTEYAVDITYMVKSILFILASSESAAAQIAEDRFYDGNADLSEALVVPSTLEVDDARPLILLGEDSED